MSDDEKTVSCDIKIGQGNYSEKIGGDYIQEQGNKTTVDAPNASQVNINHLYNSQLPEQKTNENASNIKPRLFQITLSGTFDETSYSDIEQIKLDFLRKVKGFNSNIIEVEEGSIKLTFEGSEEDFERFKALIKTKKLAEVAGKTIQSVKLIDSEIEEKEIRKKVKARNDLVQEIRSQNIDRRNLTEANLKFSDLNHVHLRNADLFRADLRNADLFRADLRNADLFRADLSGSYLLLANLSGANLSDANLSYANLSRADLRSANLFRTNLSGTNLSCTNLNGTNLILANLSGVNLRNANLRNAYLSGANLRSANLRSANLSGANLFRTNLILANLSGAMVTNARFTNSKEISQSMKENLIQRGAIFEDAPGYRSRVLSRN